MGKVQGMASNPSHTAREVQHSAQRKCTTPMREQEVRKVHARKHRQGDTNPKSKRTQDGQVCRYRERDTQQVHTSRRQQRRQAMENPESAQTTNRQPRWQEVTSQQAWAEEEAKRMPHLVWNMDRLDELRVPAFSSAPNSITNALPTH